MPDITFDLRSRSVPVRKRYDLRTDPMCSGLSCARDSAKTEETPATSTGSPANVPVPWHSRYDVREKSVMLAFLYAVRTAFAWASALGDAIPGVRPLWLFAVPRITARIGSPACTASSSRFKITALIPSAFIYPSALASNVWQRPVGEWVFLIGPAAPSHQLLNLPAFMFYLLSQPYSGLSFISTSLE